MIDVKDVKAVRAWAASNDIELSSRGRVRSARSPAHSSHRSLRTEEIEQQQRAGPSAGPKPEPMMVPRGASRSNRRANPSSLSWARGFLPSWSCEFDSRHPLHIIVPSQGHLQSARHIRTSGHNNDQAGHAASMIMSARSTELSCPATFGPTNPAMCCS
jgi:hypothetical protein